MLLHLEAGLLPNGSAEAVRPFSMGGDSGSFIFDSENRGVGLLFAGSETAGPGGHGLTYANVLDAALGLLGLTAL